MGAFIAKQPNGKLCRFSSVVDSITNYNMTEEDYIELCAEQAREQARYNLEHPEYFLKDFNKVIENFRPGEMTQEEFDKILKEVGYTN